MDDEDLLLPSDEGTISPDYVVPRPSRDRAMWLMRPSSSACRLKIDTFQYEELRSEARALEEELKRLKSFTRMKELLRRHHNYVHRSQHTDDQELTAQIEEALRVLA